VRGPFERACATELGFAEVGWRELGLRERSHLGEQVVGVPWRPPLQCDLGAELDAAFAAVAPAEPVERLLGLREPLGSASAGLFELLLPGGA
jgi:hypothetical protein